MVAGPQDVNLHKKLRPFGPLPVCLQLVDLLHRHKAIGLSVDRAPYCAEAPLPQFHLLWEVPGDELRTERANGNELY